MLPKATNPLQGEPRSGPRATPAERPMTRQHLEQDDAEREQIGPVIDFRSRDLFGRPVEGVPIITRWCVPTT